MFSFFMALALLLSSHTAPMPINPGINPNPGVNPNPPPISCISDCGLKNPNPPPKYPVEPGKNANPPKHGP